MLSHFSNAGKEAEGASLLPCIRIKCCGTKHAVAARPNDSGVGAGQCQALAPFFPNPAMLFRPLKLLWLGVRSWGLALQRVSMLGNEVREEQVSHPRMT